MLVSAAECEILQMILVFLNQQSLFFCDLLACQYYFNETFKKGVRCQTSKNQKRNSHQTNDF